MTLCINQSGTHRNIKSLCINQSGTYRTITTGCINQSGTYRLFIFIPALGASYEGGFLICKQSLNLRWVVAPNSAQVSRTWYSRNDANTTAQSVSGCTGWFVPTSSQLQNPGFSCRSYWDSYCPSSYWSSTAGGDSPYSQFNGGSNHAPRQTGVTINMSDGTSASPIAGDTCCIRSFRCISY